MHALVFVLSGIASWYDLPGNTMADGHVFRSLEHVCAMRREPFGDRILIVNTDNGRKSWCIVEDRGPNIHTDVRVIDVSPIVRDELGFTGLARVRLYREVIHAQPIRRISPRSQFTQSVQRRGADRLCVHRAHWHAAPAGCHRDRAPQHLRPNR
jgi:rare lipoprotein A